MRVHGFRVRPHAGDEVLLAVAIDDEMQDERIVGDLLLDVGGRNVLAAGSDEDVLLAIDDLEKAVVREAAHVAGLEPAIVGEGFFRGRGILVVAAEDARAAREDLAVLGELELDRREHLSDGVEAKRIGAIERERGRRLGEAVPLDDERSRFPEELLHLALQPRAA